MNMLKWLNNKKKDNKGFSLVELIIVVAIMAILVGLLAPQYVKYIEKSRKSADVSNLDQMVQAVQVYAADADTTLVKGNYKIEITSTTTNVPNTLKPALEETVPDYASIKLKSNKWDSTGKGKTTAISATITVDENGGTKVKYEPVELEKFAAKGAATKAGE